MAGLSALITNCQANVFKKTLKIVTGSSNFYDKLLGSLLSVLSNIFLIKDKQFKKLHLCLVGGGSCGGGEEITVPWRLMYLVKQSVFKPKWKRARNSSELHDKTLEILFMTQFVTAVCRCLILWVRSSTFFVVFKIISRDIGSEFFSDLCHHVYVKSTTSTSNKLKLPPLLFQTCDWWEKASALWLWNK